MDKKQLANLIHEYNLACKDPAKKGENCRLCWQIACQVMIQESVALQHEACRPFEKEHRS